MKNIKIFLISFLCVSFFANNFAMRKPTLQERIEKVRLLKIYADIQPCMKKELTDCMLKILPGLSKQNKNLKIKIEALFCWGEYFFLKKDGQPKALEYFSKVIELSEKFKKDKNICEFSLDAIFNIAQIYLHQAFDLFKNSIHQSMTIVECTLVKSTIVILCKKALSFYKRVIEKEKDCPKEAVALLNIAGISELLYKIEGGKEEEINRVMKTYFKRCVKKAKIILAREKSKEHPNKFVIDRMTDIYSKAIFNLSGEELTPRKKDQYKLFKDFAEVSREFARLELLMPQMPVSPEVAKASEDSLREAIRNKERIENRFTCKVCSKTGKKLKKCGRCKEVYYCSRDCQVEDWEAGHKNTCKKK